MIAPVSSRDEMAGLYDHGIVEPIIACHRIKMLFALEDELATRRPTRPGPIRCARR